MIGWFLREREAHTLCTSAYAPPTQEALGRTSPVGTGSPLTSPTSCSQSGCRGGTCWWCLWQRWAQKQSVLFDNMIFLINGVWCFYSRGFVMQNMFHPKKSQWPKNVETSGCWILPFCSLGQRFTLMMQGQALVFKSWCGWRHSDSYKTRTLLHFHVYQHIALFSRSY